MDNSKTQWVPKQIIVHFILERAKKWQEFIIVIGVSSYILVEFHFVFYFFITSISTSTSVIIFANLTFLSRNLRQNIPSDCVRFTSLHFATIFFTEWVRQPWVRIPTWCTRSLHLCPSDTVWPSHSPRHRIPVPQHSSASRTGVEIF
jgi:hypothetical protein